MRKIKRSTVFTADALTRIREMKTAGATSDEIADAIGTTVASLRARCSQLQMNMKFEESKRAVMAA
jgi:hypothetical protein